MQAIKIKMYFRKVINIFTGWYRKFFKKDSELSKTRLEICSKCEHNIRLTKNVHICGLCGCELVAKSLVESEKCLNDKW